MCLQGTYVNECQPNKAHLCGSVMMHQPDTRDGSAESQKAKAQDSNDEFIQNGNIILEKLIYFSHTYNITFSKYLVGLCCANAFTVC